MKNIISLVIILIVILCMCGCKNTENNENTIVMPDSTTAETVNGYKSEQPINSKSANITYVVNKSTKKFHLESCRYAKNSNTSSLMKSTDRSTLINDGYSPCKICKP